VEGRPAFLCRWRIWVIAAIGMAWLKRPFPRSDSRKSCSRRGDLDWVAPVWAESVPGPG
jgi:hypothetical protein